MRRPICALAAALLAVLLLAATARAELAFAPCAEKGQEGFECATLKVPLDRSGRVPGTLRLRVQRLVQPIQPEAVLMNVEGGPGGSATARSQQSARLFEPLRGAYQLVLVDPRGIGASRPYLRCSPRAARCARQLGAAGRFYTTADSVADLDAVRAALGAAQVFVYGTSYGTYVAQQYARTHPDRTERIALDSPVPPTGVDPLQIELFAAIAPMLRRLCSDGACAGLTRDVVGDTRRLARRLERRPLRTVVRAPGKEPQRVKLGGDDLLDALVNGDENVALRALYPGALRAALAGDGAPLARMLVLGAEHHPPRFLNPSMYVPTNCADMRLPWRRDASRRERERALERAFARVPAAAVSPFPRSVLEKVAVAPACLGWPATSLDRAVTDRPPPAVPTLVLSGLADLRTSPADAAAIARAFPAAQVIEVPHRAHGVLRTNVECGQRALLAFVADQPVGNPCAASEPLLDVQPLPPRRAARARPAPGVPGRRGRIVAAARHTVDDAVALAPIAAPGGGSFSVAGLRGGAARGERAAATTLRLDRYSAVRGVALTGTLSAPDGEPPRGSLRLRAGRLSGTLAFAPDGSVSGRLGGRPVATGPPPGAA